MSELQGFLGTELISCQDKYAQSTNNSPTPAPAVQVSDQVFISTQNIRTTRTSHKLYWKGIGPFLIKKIVSLYSYEVTLPASVKLHPTFHVSLHNPVPTNALAGESISPPLTVIIQANEQYEIKEILDSKLACSWPRYNVKWIGFDETTGESAECHTDSTGVDSFQDTYPTKPGSWKF